MWIGRPTAGGRDLVYGGMRRRGSVKLNGKHRTTSGGILTVHWLPPDYSWLALVVHDPGVEIWYVETEEESVTVCDNFLF
jgi:WD40 repeat protein